MGTVQGSFSSKGLLREERVDYDEIFSLMVRHTSIRVVLAMVAHMDMELEQMDVKTTFFMVFGGTDLHETARRV